MTKEHFKSMDALVHFLMIGSLPSSHLEDITQFAWFVDFLGLIVLMEKLPNQPTFVPYLHLRGEQAPKGPKRYFSAKGVTKPRLAYFLMIRGIRCIFLLPSGKGQAADFVPF